MKAKTCHPVPARTIYVVRNPDGTVWCKLLYRAMADHVALREPERRLTVHEELEK